MAGQVKVTIGIKNAGFMASTYWEQVSRSGWNTEIPPGTGMLFEPWS